MGKVDLPKDSAHMPCMNGYLHLRDELLKYHSSQKLPALSLLQSPTGGLERLQQHLLTQDIPLDRLSNMADMIEENCGDLYQANEMGEN